MTARFRIEQQHDERIERKKGEDGGRSTGRKKNREKERERIMRGARDAGSARCKKKRREKERGEGHAMEKTERGDKEIRTWWMKEAADAEEPL